MDFWNLIYQVSDLSHMVTQLLKFWGDRGKPHTYNGRLLSPELDLTLVMLTNNLLGIILWSQLYLL